MQILISMDEGSLSSIYKKENPSPVKKQLVSLERKEYYLDWFRRIVVILTVMSLKDVRL